MDLHSHRSSTDHSRTDLTPTAGASPAHLSRRNFLRSSSAALVAGLVAARIGGIQPAHAHGDLEGHTGHSEHGLDAGRALGIWAATRGDDGRYLALSGDADHPDIAALEVDAHGGVHLGATLGASFPQGFAPLALLATAGRVLVAGAMVHEQEALTVDYSQDSLHPADRDGIPTDKGFLEGTATVSVHSVRPSLVEVSSTGPRELPLADNAPGAFGVATGIVGLRGNRLAVVIESADEPEQAYNDITRLAVSTDRDGLSWEFEVIASGLGEGRRSHLAATNGRLFAVTVDQSGVQRFHERQPQPGAAWRDLATDGGEGLLLAAVGGSRDAVEILAGVGGEVARLRNEPGRSGWQRAGTVKVPGDVVVTTIPVSGTDGEVVVVGRTNAVLDR